MFCPQCGSQNDDSAVFCKTCGFQLSSTGVPQPAVPTKVSEYAGFWRRFVAALIDGVIVGIVFFFLSSLFGLETMSEDFDLNPISNFISILLGWLYYALMESSVKQATLGKMAIGIIVTDTNGGRISFARATGRHFSKIISAIILMIGYIMAGLSPRKQALHDIITDCLVITNP
ncbi:MAG: RDD family protein [Candidatus Electryoneaceae bacterium]|nr:RDD family protein [Candidatus Electryoneaceae bacterium]